MDKQQNLNSEQDFINKIFKLYYKETEYKPIKVNVEFVEDIYIRKLELAIDDKEKKEIISSKEFIKNLNGTMVIPAINEDNPYILINLDILKNNKNKYQFISTITHELTHVHDYYNYYEFNKDKFSNIRDIEKCKDFTVFQLWSEYNARRKGYYFYRYIMVNINDISQKEQIDFILNEECTFQMKYTKEQLIKSFNDPYQFLYNIIQFIGRFSVWNDLFPEYFNVNTLPEQLIEAFDTRIIELYEFLYKNITFDEIKLKFDQLEILLCNFISDK